MLISRAWGSPVKAIVYSATISLALTACDESTEFAELGYGEPIVGGTETVQADVLAPEAFSITDMALWDGRPTFGGVWIAYPDIDNPERVRIHNDANGKDVIGALYKRERDFPGPRIELSADAALSLGVLAGTPIELTIVALRRQDVEIEVETPDVEEVAIPETEATPETASVVETTPAIAASELVAADGMTSPVLRGGADIVAAPAPTESVVASQPRASNGSGLQGFFASIFGPPRTTAPTTAAAIEPVGAVPENGDIVETALALPESIVSAVPEVEVASVAATEPAQTETISGDTYIQVATFQSEGTANEWIKKLETAGLSASVRTRDSNGKTLYRVVVGPATTAEEIQIMMSVINELGFNDAIILG